MANSVKQRRLGRKMTKNMFRYLYRLLVAYVLNNVFWVVLVLKSIFGPIISMFRRQKISDQEIIVRTPPEAFNGLYNAGYGFKPNYVELSIGGDVTLPRIHYVDEGARGGEVILCLHGEPSWSFLYRRMITAFKKTGVRCVCPDFIGFGKSDKYTHPDMYTHQMHTMSLRMLIDHLDLTNITLVCQDWGGMVGLSVVKDMPDRFSRIVVMNTGLLTGQHALPYAGQAWQKAIRLFGQNFPFEKMFRNVARMPADVIQHYMAPFPSSLYTAGAAKWPLLVPTDVEDIVAVDMRATRRFLQENWSKPMLVMFSDNDPVFAEANYDFLRMVPHANHLTIHGGGHFLQETKGEELAHNIMGFIKGEL